MSTGDVHLHCIQFFFLSRIVSIFCQELRASWQLSGFCLRGDHILRIRSAPSATELNCNLLQIFVWVFSVVFFFYIVQPEFKVRTGIQEASFFISVSNSSDDCIVYRGYYRASVAFVCTFYLEFMSTGIFGSNAVTMIVLSNQWARWSVIAQRAC